jgi:hypothetical protein
MFVETRIMLDPSTTKNGTDIVLHFNISDDSYSICSIFAGQDMQEVDCWSSLSGVDQKHYKLAIEPGTWHIVRIETDPTAMKVVYLVDNKEIGSFVLQDGNLLRVLERSLVLRMHNWGESAKNPVAYFDNVRMGAIEDDLASQEPFSRVVGEWESADWSDGSLMAMTIKRVSAGQYTFSLVDSSTGFCDGGSGKVEFQADTFSNTATGIFEFACDSTDQRGNFEYKFTYNSVSDQFVDADGVIWNRKK